jgi:hypothetical protein
VEGAPVLGGHGRGEQEVKGEEEKGGVLLDSLRKKFVDDTREKKC